MDIKTMLKKRSSATVANGGFMHSVVSEGRIHALIWWFHDTVRKGAIVDPNQWTDITCMSAMIALDAQ
eukprot:4068317-Ditylum_brightwellii.AAC.2